MTAWTSSAPCGSARRSCMRDATAIQMAMVMRIASPAASATASVSLRLLADDAAVIDVGLGNRVMGPPMNLQDFFNCVFVKYTVQPVLLYSLNPKFSTGKRYKLYSNFTFYFSFWGLRSTNPLVRLPTTRTPSIVNSWAHT